VSFSAFSPCCECAEYRTMVCLELHHQSSSFVSQVRVRLRIKGNNILWNNKEIVDSAVNRNYLLSVMTPKWLSSATVKNPRTAMAINSSSVTNTAKR
jgi:hypothetical protein